MAIRPVLFFYCSCLILVFVEATIFDRDLLLDNPVEHEFRDISFDAENQSGSRNRSRREGPLGIWYRGFRPNSPQLPTISSPVRPSLSCIAPADGGPVPACLSKAECTAQGGKSGKACGKGFSRGYCCQHEGIVECGDSTSLVRAVFRNPEWPDLTTQKLLCQIEVVPKSDACGIRIEFMDGILATPRNGFCFQDMFTIGGGGTVESSGFNTQMCGRVKGFATVVPVNQTTIDPIQLIMFIQSGAANWNVNITQIPCSTFFMPVNSFCGVRNNPALSARSLQALPRIHNESTWTEEGRTEHPRVLLHFAQPRVLGGDVTNGNQFPWMAVILIKSERVCAGTLIDASWVITAAHCVAIFDAENESTVSQLQVWLGALDVSMSQSAETRRVVRKVSRVYVHNEFQGTDFDVALLQLNESVPFTVAIRPACFPQDKDTNFAGETGIIAGWGSRGGPERSSVLLAGTMPIWSNTECNTAWADQSVTIRESMMCAGDGSVAMCTVSFSSSEIHILFIN
ncbi:Hypothetical predicted protein [Cloeon dipterum]|uniref:Peptidase S1 domain-containing protein n=1 Tax=Cloeon dipterum TaxID=197152 RepID=A0A8S1D4N7_9INSE|nr:Hypothetical predicted protein [Cloeon dipterum]